jgi:hypothetical protein
MASIRVMRLSRRLFSTTTELRTSMPWARFSVTPACRLVRRSWRLRSGSPPCGGQGRPPHSSGGGHLRASRRPAWWLWRTSPGGHSRGSPTRHCACRSSKAGGTMPCTARPPVREFPCPGGHGCRFCSGLTGCCLTSRACRRFRSRRRRWRPLSCSPRRHRRW